MFLTKQSILLQLWEDAQLENIRLRDDLNKVRDDLKSTKKKLDTAIAVSTLGPVWPDLLFSKHT